MHTHTRASKLELVAALLLLQTFACHDEPEPLRLVQETPGEPRPCPTPQHWTAVIHREHEGCGIAFGDDPQQRLADALAQASGGDIDDYGVVGELDSDVDASLSVVAAARRETDGGQFSYTYRAGGFPTCVPEDSESSTLEELLAGCEGCMIECEAAVDGCEDCCDSPADCSVENPCCPGELCIERPGAKNVPGPDDNPTVCVPACEVDSDCHGYEEHCRDVEGTQTRACI